MYNSKEMITAAATPRATPIPTFVPSERPLDEKEEDDVGDWIGDALVVAAEDEEEVDVAADVPSVWLGLDSDDIDDACEMLIWVVVVIIVAAPNLDVEGLAVSEDSARSLDDGNGGDIFPFVDDDGDGVVAIAWETETGVGDVLACPG